MVRRVGWSGYGSSPTVLPSRMRVVIGRQNGVTFEIKLTVLPSVTADNVQSVLELRIDDDILLVKDGNNIFPPCAKSLGIKHEALNQSAGERVRHTKG